MRGGTVLQIYTGDGKGKTTAAVGLAARAAGHGGRVAFIQLMKEGVTEAGEFASLRSLEGVRVLRFGQSMLEAGHDEERCATALREGLAEAKRILEAREVDLLVLDEANVACAEGLVGTADLLAVLDAAGEDVTVVLTGRNAPAEVIDRADLVTEMVARRHPYDAGLGAREGIDY